MYTKKILSAAAAVAVLSTGAMAFDTYTNVNNDNFIATDGKTQSKTITRSSYINAVTAGLNTLSLSADRRGDALIYPAFTQKDGFGSEIVVRNTSDYAIVAKAVFYAGSDSEELIDFNLYLSAHDVARFQIKDGQVTSTDGSIKTFGILPIFVDPANHTKEKTDTKDVDFADNVPFTFKGLTAEKYQGGYVAIFGMVQANQSFHKKHANLYGAYAQLLDNVRPNWRDLKNANVLLGSLFVANELTAPNVTIDPNNSFAYHTFDSKGDLINLATVQFGEVSDNALSGDVRIFDAFGHDMLLPARALNGFSYDGGAMDHVQLWTEGEYASIADRCIEADGVNSINTSYNVACLTSDSSIFNVSEAVYTYANKSGEAYNKILITQPYKRTFVQLQETSVATGLYTGTANQDLLVKKELNVDTGIGYSFETSATIYDEDEGTLAEKTSGSIIVSGVDNITQTTVTYHKELQELTPEVFELRSDAKDTLGKGNGYATFRVGVPAIITQMVATKSGEDVETNWIYSTIK